MSKIISILILLFLLIPISSFSQDVPDSVAGRVIEVHDGDTFTVELCNGLHLSIRLIGVDAPELKQKSGTLVRDYISSLILNKTVMLSADKKKYDSYGRFLMYVFVDDIFLNKLLLQKGYAVAAPYKPNIKFEPLFSKEAAEAKKNKIGLWQTNEFDITPKEFRDK